MAKKTHKKREELFQNSFLERKVVGCGLGGEIHRLGTPGGSRRRSALHRRRRCHAILPLAVTAAKKLHLVSYDFRGVTLAPVLVRPLTGTDTAFDIQLRPFVDILLGYVRETSPNDDVVPFGVFTLLAAAVCETLGSGKRECGNLGSVALGISFKVTYFGVFSNVTDQHYFIQTHI